MSNIRKPEGETFTEQVFDSGETNAQEVVLIPIAHDATFTISGTTLLTVQVNNGLNVGGQWVNASPALTNFIPTVGGQGETIDGPIEGLRLFLNAAATDTILNVRTSRFTN